MLRKLQAALVVALIMASILGLRAQEASDPEELAILIVGNESNAEMLRLEKTLIPEIGRQLSRWPADKRPPIFSYHFDKKKERAYCEQKLNILAEDLLFVGIVRLDKKVPRKVVYRIDRLINPARSADELVDRAQEMLGVSLENNGTASPSPSPSPSESPEPPDNPPDNEGSWKIQLGVFTQRRNAEDLVAKLREKGHVATIVSTDENGANAFKVQIGPFGTRQEALTAVDALKSQGFTQAIVVEDGD